MDLALDGDGERRDSKVVRLVDPRRGYTEQQLDDLDRCFRHEERDEYFGRIQGP